MARFGFAIGALCILQGPSSGKAYTGKRGRVFIHLCHILALVALLALLYEWLLSLIAFGPSDLQLCYNNNNIHML